MTLGDMLANSAKAGPKRKAIVFKNQQLSYEELNQRAICLAQNLRQLGLKTGDQVAVLLPNCPEYIIAMFGIFKAGGVLVPINSFLTPNEAAYILEDCEAATLISSAKFSRQLAACSKLDTLKNTIMVGEVRSGQARSRQSCSGQVSFDKLLAPNTSVQLPKLNPDNRAIIIYTSGTTGHPKGALLSHNNIIANVSSCSKVIKLSHKDRFLVFLPLFHSFTLTVTVFFPCFLGARIILLETIARDEIRQAVVRLRPSVMVGIPTVYNLFSQMSLSWVARWMNPVRIYVSGGAPLAVEVLEKFQQKFRRTLLEGYGLSEASPVVAINPPQKAKAGSVGLPVPDVEVKILNNQGNLAKANEVGELLVRGPNVMQGYLNRPQATKKSLIDGWLHTGDMARIDEEGYIFIVDRKKEMLIVHGSNVYPREIEDVL